MRFFRRLLFRFLTLPQLRDERASALMWKAWLLSKHVAETDPDMQWVCGWVDDVNSEFARRGLV